MFTIELAKKTLVQQEDNAAQMVAKWIIKGWQITIITNIKYIKQINGVFLGASGIWEVQRME